MAGVISVAANAFPQRFASMINAALKYDFQKARALNAALLEGYDLMFCENNPSGVKAFLAEQGLIENYLRLPGVPLSKQNHQKVREYLANVNVD
jgi:4-hydroxy-tetrahydrodipicolinate synthase